MMCQPDNPIDPMEPDQDLLKRIEIRKEEMKIDR